LIFLKDLEQAKNGSLAENRCYNSAQREAWGYISEFKKKVWV